VALALGVLLAACGPKSLKDRTRHGEQLADDASSLLDGAEGDLNKMEIDRAEEQLQQAQKLVTQPDIELSPEGEMLQSRLAELQARVAPTRDEKAKRELDALVEKQRDQLVRALGEVTTAQEALEHKDAGKPQVDALLQAVDRTHERLKEGKPLEARSEEYAASARRIEHQLDQATAKAHTVQSVLEFVAGPATTRQQGEALLKQAKTEKNRDKKLLLYTDARDHFQRCGEAAKQWVAKSPELEKSPIQVDGQTTTPRAVTSGCTSRADSLQKTVAKLEQAKAAREKKKKG
jgi:hypothetical protein